MSIWRRLEALEAGTAGAGGQDVSIALRIHCKATERYRARVNGEEPPPYTQAEIDAMRERDLETVASGGATAELRDAPGWQGPEAQQMLDAWEAGARRRLEKAKVLPPSRWAKVWGVDNENEDLKGDRA